MDEHVYVRVHAGVDVDVYVEVNVCVYLDVDIAADLIRVPSWVVSRFVRQLYGVVSRLVRQPLSS